MAIATNMISVGLDITRLGLMVVLGQPKTCAEYIQATSRVGRDPSGPAWSSRCSTSTGRATARTTSGSRSSTSRSTARVEATSVTPFSPRALDRGLAGTLVALARLGHAPMTPPKGAVEILTRAERARLRGPDASPTGRAATPLWRRPSPRRSARASATGRRTCSTTGARSPTTTRTRARPCSTTRRGRGGQAVAARLPRPRAQDHARPAQEIPGEPLDARRRAEREPLAARRWTTSRSSRRTQS